jgi:regulator of replication initiation timing
MSEQVDKRTASQRIEDLEKVVTTIYQATANIKHHVENLLKESQDMAMVKEALKLVNRKTEAMIQVSASAEGMTVKSVSDAVVQMNIADLTQQVEGYLANGHIVAADSVAENSFIVCEELGSDGEVANPRVQFRMDSQDASVLDLLRGKLVGDTVSFGENKLSAKILEIYSLVEPKAEEAAPAETAAPEAAPSALEASETAPESDPTT